MANDEKHPRYGPGRSAASRVRQARGGFSGRAEGTLWIRAEGSTYAALGAE